MFTLLQAPAAAAQQQSMWPSIMMIVLLFVIVYFFMIRPQQKRQKEIQQFRDALKVGDEVVTIGGLHGTIKQIGTDGTVVLRVANGVEVKFEKSAITPTGTQPAQPV